MDGLDHLSSKFVDTFLHEQLISGVGESTPWVLFDSGASAHLLNFCGRRLVGLSWDGQDCFMYFYVCDTPYPIVSVARLLLQGFRVALDGPDSLGLFTPNGKVLCVRRGGSLLFLCPFRVTNLNLKKRVKSFIFRDHSTHI